MLMSWRRSTGAVTPVEGRLEGFAGDLGAVLDEVDAGGGRGDPLFEDLAAEQGVDEGALAGVELAGDDEEEELVELPGGPLEGLLVLGRGVEPRQCLPESCHQPAVLGQQLLFLLFEDPPQHRSPHPGDDSTGCARGRVDAWARVKKG